MQPAMPAADLLDQLMSPPPHSTQAAVPFVPAFSPTPQQHQPAGHTLPQPMQPPCATAAFAQPFSPTQQQHQPMGHTVPQPTQAPFATSAFTQPPSFHTFNTPHYNTAMPGFQPPPHYNAAIPKFQLSPPQCGSFVTYQPTPHPTITTSAQPLPTTPASQQYPTTTVPTPPQRKSYQAQPYTFSHHTQEAQFHQQAAQTTQMHSLNTGTHL